jgi:hypothetical protein
MREHEIQAPNSLIHSKTSKNLYSLMVGDMIEAKFLMKHL